MRTQQDRTKQNRLVLPLGQTVFLPQTAMGVSYIDKVRTKVYIDNLQRQEGRRNACLRGFYEIDLEYHGLEGQRLYKHRVMLPLRVELPDDWLLPLDYEADELHAVISKPMLRILSPYVLEFSGQLVVEYVGDLMHRFDDDCDDDDDDDDDGLEYRGHRAGHAQVVHGGGDGLDGVGPDDGAGQVEPAAAQAVAAKGHGQDGGPNRVHCAEQKHGADEHADDLHSTRGQRLRGWHHPECRHNGKTHQDFHQL